MSSSDSSDDSDDLQKLLESADPHFLPDSLFKNASDPIHAKKNIANSVAQDVPKSQRYLLNNETFDTDLKIPQSMQDHIAKRLSEIIARKIEFADPPNKAPEQPEKRKSLWRSRVRLLKDFDVPIKPFEEYQWDVKCPEKKLEIKRRVVEPDDMETTQKVAVAAVDPAAILTGREIAHWAQRRERKDKVFRYKRSKTGNTLHFVEPENEFTKLRKKNCWSEKRIATWKPK